MYYSAARRSLRARVPHHSDLPVRRYPPEIGPPAAKLPRASVALPAASAFPENETGADSSDRIESSIHPLDAASPRDAYLPAPSRFSRRTQSRRALYLSRNLNTRRVPLASDAWDLPASRRRASAAQPISVREVA